MTALLKLVVLATAALVCACGGAPPEPPKLAQIEKLADGLYLITGGGGNTAALITDAGVVLVDTKLPGWNQAILDRLRTVTDKPVTMIINTHSHGDHVLGNSGFGQTPTIVAHQRTRDDMATFGDFQGANARYLPAQTYSDKLSLVSGRIAIVLYHFGAAHTDGDTVVVFPAQRIAHVGDLFKSKIPPNIDRFHGGSALAYPTTLARILDGLPGVDRVITGHGAVLSWNELREYTDFTKHLVDWSVSQHKAGRREADAAAAYRIPERFRDYSEAWRAEGDVRIVYRELNRQAPWKFLWYTRW